MCITTQYTLSMVIITLKKTTHSTVLFTSMIICPPPQKKKKKKKKKTVDCFFLYSLQQHVIYTVLYTVCCRANDCMGSTFTIEGFGGKRALGFLLKSELCQKRSKFRMQFCLRVSNNVLHVFSLKFAFFFKYYVCEKTHFSKGILWGPFVEWKTKETFCFA